MGKKNKYDKLGYFGKAEADDKMAKKYGISKDDFTTDLHGGGRYEQFNDGAYKKAIARAAANDYDVRRSVEAAKLAGNKKAEKLGKGISNMSEAYAAERFMKKTHKKRLGNTGEYSSANDEANVTDYWVNKDRDNLRTEFISKLQGQRDTNKNTSGSDNIRRDRPVSTELSEARARIAQHDEDIYSGTYSSNLFDKNYDPAGANNFLDRYKLKLNEQRQRYA